MSSLSSAVSPFKLSFEQYWKLCSSLYLLSATGASPLNLSDALVAASKHDYVSGNSNNKAGGSSGAQMQKQLSSDEMLLQRYVYASTARMTCSARQHC
jgi:hypothetical protein